MVPTAKFVHLDVTDRASVQRAVDAVVREFGGVAGVVHCAGVGALAKTVSGGEPHDPGIFEACVRVNLLGTFYVCSVAAAAMCKQPPSGGDRGRGVIVTVASTAAVEGQKGQLAYAASKGGVAAMTLPMARDLARHGIRCVCVAPGPFATPMGLQIPPDARDRLLADVQWPKRMGKPAEFGGLVRHIVENAYLNATLIRLDAGVRMSNL